MAENFQRVSGNHGSRPPSFLLPQSKPPRCSHRRCIGRHSLFSSSNGVERTGQHRRCAAGCVPTSATLARIPDANPRRGADFRCLRTPATRAAPPIPGMDGRRRYLIRPKRRRADSQHCESLPSSRKIVPDLQRNLRAELFLCFGPSTNPQHAGVVITFGSPISGAILSAAPRQRRPERLRPTWPLLMACRQVRFVDKPPRARH